MAIKIIVKPWQGAPGRGIWFASFASDPGVYQLGISAAAAIGELIQQNEELSGIVVEYPTPTFPPRRPS